MSNYFQYKVQKFLVETQVFVSLCAAVLCWTVMLWNEKVDYLLLCFVFFSTLFAYNWAVFNIEKRERNKEVLIIFSALSALGMAYLSIKELSAFLGLALLAIPTLLYNHTFFQLKFRSVPFLKLFLIAFVWSCTVCIIPWLNSAAEFSNHIILQSSVIFFFIIALIIPFDIRDIGSDHYSLMTLPQFIGIKKAKIVAYTSLFLSLIFLLFAYPNQPIILISFLITNMVAAFLIYKSNVQQPKIFFGFWVESMSILPSILYITLSYLTK